MTASCTPADTGGHTATLFGACLALAHAEAVSALPPYVSWREIALELVDLVSPTAERLGCLPYLERVRGLAKGPTWADRQLQAFKKTGDPTEVVRRS